MNDILSLQMLDPSLDVAKVCLSWQSCNSDTSCKSDTSGAFADSPDGDLATAY